ncbi:MAG: hypothetical protein ACI4XA_10270 [Oscillospiraceae bacterium]
MSKDIYCCPYCAYCFKTRTQEMYCRLNELYVNENNICDLYLNSVESPNIDLSVFLTDAPKPTTPRAAIIGRRKILVPIFIIVAELAAMYPLMSLLFRGD